MNNYQQLRDKMESGNITPQEMEALIEQHPKHITRFFAGIILLVVGIGYLYNKSDASAKAAQGIPSSYIQMFVAHGTKANIRECQGKKCAVVRTVKEHTRFFVDELKQKEEWVPVYQVKKGGYVQYDSDKEQVGYVHQSLLVYEIATTKSKK